MKLEIWLLQPARLLASRSCRFPGGLNVAAPVAVTAGAARSAAARAFVSLLRGSKTAFQWVRMWLNNN